MSQETSAGPKNVSPIGSVSTAPINERNFNSADELLASLLPDIKLAPGRQTKFIFRGHGDSRWPLLGQALRLDRKSGLSVAMAICTGPLGMGAENQVFAEIRLLCDFVEQCDKSGLSLPGDSEAFRQEWLDDQRMRSGDPYRFPSLWPDLNHLPFLAAAQHAGLPTRLLDWSKNPLTAAYFAARDPVLGTCGEKLETLCIWAFDIELVHLYDRVRLVRPPGSVSPNMAAQAGLFSVVLEDAQRGAPAPAESLDAALYGQNVGGHPSPLWKLTLDVKHAGRLLQVCEAYGFDAARAFPGYAGSAAATIERMAAFQWDRLYR